MFFLLQCLNFVSKFIHLGKGKDRDLRLIECVLEGLKTLKMRGWEENIKDWNARRRVLKEAKVHTECSAER